MIFTNFDQNQMQNPSILSQNSNSFTNLPNNNSSKRKNKKFQDSIFPLLVPQKLKEACFYITKLNISQQMKDNLIKDILKNANNTTPNKSNFSACTKNSRVLFTKEEDEKIKKLVEIIGTSHWNIIALCMEGRTTKQCRDRYLNYLMPGYFQGEWSKEEDELLIKLYKEYGSKWSVIKKFFPRRGCNNIKGRWYYFISKQNQDIVQTNSTDTDQINNENINQNVSKENNNQTNNS